MPSNTLQAAATTNWQTAANWSLFLAPTTGQDVVVANATTLLSAGLLNTATLASLSVGMTFTGTAGLARQAVQAITSINRSVGTATVVTSAAHGYSTGDVVIVAGAVETDYNLVAAITVTNATTFTYTVANTPTTPATTASALTVRKYEYLRQPATLFTGGTPVSGNAQPGGTNQWHHDFSTVQTNATIMGSNPTAADTYGESYRLLGSHASNVLNVLGAVVGVATLHPGETATFATINQTAGALNLGAGTSWTTIYQSGGTATSAAGSAAGTVHQNKDATLTLTGAGEVSVINAGGTVNLSMRKSGGGATVATLNLADGAVVDLTGNPAAITITTVTVAGRATIKTNPANPGHLTITNPVTRGAGSQINFA